MIYNQWYVILESKEVKKGKPFRVQRLNEWLCLWRDSRNKVWCIEDKCPHRGASLGCGRIIDDKLECPFHGFIYDGSGKVLMIPANGKNSTPPETMKVRSYRVFEGSGLIWIWWGDDEKASTEPFFFSELAGYSYSTFIDHWNVHYSRAIENQLDVVHLPFVHKTTIGRGNKTLVNGPVVVRENELLTFYVNNVEDDGKTVPRKPEEITDYKNYFYLRFHFPNIWQNYISDEMRVFAAFVPVDNENTIIYLRNYQKFITIPVLKGIINYLSRLFNIIILRQDKRIVITQLPKKSTLRMNENLITGDRPIIEYRKHRDKLIQLNNRS